MLLIHKSQSRKKLFFLVITSICSIGTFLGFYGLTYTPELSHAETITYPEKETRDMSQITYMQDITPEICQNSELNKQYTLTDKRDDNTYTIARIKNQTDEKTNCWMTQNLRIINKKISYLDSDIEEGNFTIPASSISGFLSADANKGKAYLSSEYGGYYNWHTATAGFGTLITTNNVNVSSSICPKNWKLPPSLGKNDNGYYNFLYGLNTNIITKSPYNFVKAGYIFEGEFFDKDSAGRLWSSSRRNTGFSGLLVFDNNTGLGFSSGNYYPGYNVRCMTTAAELKPNDNIDIMINPHISLDMANEVNIGKSETNPSTANLDVKVTSNQNYSVGISAANPDLTSTTSEVKIPAKTGLLNTAENGWGIKLKDDTEFTTLTSTLQTFYTASGAEIKTIPFTIGISTAPDLPNGEYSTDITITATQN